MLPAPCCPPPSHDTCVAPLTAACVLALQLDYTGLSDLLKRFRAADKDNNGSLALPECVTSCGPGIVSCRAYIIDSHGLASCSRFCEAMQLDPNSEYARRLFDCVDTVRVARLTQLPGLPHHILWSRGQDGNGSVDFRETVLGLSFAGDHGTEEKLRMAFAVYDTNNDGFISQDELRKVMAIGVHRRRRTIAVPAAHASRSDATTVVSLGAGAHNCEGNG